MGVLDGLLGGALAGVGSAASSWMNWQSQKETNAQNLALTQQQWGREDNAVQRRTADMEKAGLNPVLAAGNPATSSPAARLEAPQVSRNVLADALQGAQTGMNVAQTQAQTDKTNAEARSANADAALKELVTFGKGGSPGAAAAVGSVAQQRYLAGFAKEQADSLIATYKADNAEEFTKLDLENQRLGLDEKSARIRSLQLAGDLAQKEKDWYTVNQVSRLVGGVANTAQGVLGSMGKMGMLAMY